MDFNNCQIKKPIYLPKRYNQVQSILNPTIRETIEIPPPLIPPIPTINVRPPTPPIMNIEQKKQFEKEREERKKTKEEQKIKESKKPAALSDVANLIAEAARKRAQQKGIQEETFGTGCLTCPKGRYRRRLINKLKNDILDHLVASNRKSL